MHVHATKFLDLRREGLDHAGKGRLKNFKRGVRGRLKFFWRTGNRVFFFRAGPGIFLEEMGDRDPIWFDQYHYWC